MNSWEISELNLTLSLAYRTFYWGSFPNGSTVKNLPAMQKTWETQVQSLGQEDFLEEELETLFSILA